MSLALAGQPELAVGELDALSAVKGWHTLAMLSKARLLHAADRSGQPVLPMSRPSRWRHRVGLARTDRKLRHLLRQFTFHPVRDLLPSLEMAELEEHSYGPHAG